MKASTVLLALSALSFSSASLFHPRADTTTSLAPSTTVYSITPQASCLAACKVGDVNCAAACIGSAHPNSANVNQTEACVTQCPQGDGSTPANIQYGVCVQSCIAAYYPTSQTVSGAAAGNSVATTGTAKTGVVTGSAGTGSVSATATGSGAATGTAGANAASGTGSAAATSTSKAAAAGIREGASFGGIVGLMFAVFAL